jgi:uncharacterized protein YndB with AHSA1/START domain
MTQAQTKQAANDKPEFKIIRTFDAPRNIVWKAWTTADQFSQWFGPRGLYAKARIFEVKPGGMIHSVMVTPDGNEMWAKFVFREVAPQSKLVWEHSFSDKDKNITRHPMSPTWPLKLLTTVIFEDAGQDKTKITLTWVPLEATELETKTFADSLPGMNQGWGGTFDQLDTFLKNA